MNKKAERIGGSIGTVLVTGAAGFVGSHLVDLLLAEGWTVIGLDNFDPVYDPRLKRRNIALHLKNEHYTLLELDLRNLESLVAGVPHGVHVVVHIASRSTRDDPAANPLDVVDSNLRGSLNLLELCRQRRISQFVLASCGNVYGLARRRPWTEETLPVPINPLDGAKLATEHMGHCYSRQYGMTFVSMRLFNVYGPRDNPNSLISGFCTALLSGKKLRIPADEHARRDFTYVADAAYALRQAMSFAATPYEIFNIGSGQIVSIEECIKHLEAVTARRAEMQFVVCEDGEVLDSWGDIAKARSTLGYKPRTELRQGLTSYIEWYLGGLG